MSFELTVAVKRDPLERNGARGATSAPAPYTLVTLNGTLTSAATRDVVDTIAKLFDEGTESVIVDLEAIEGDEAGAFALLTEGLMTMRAAGRHVQLGTHQKPLYERLETMTDARDWLLPFSDAEFGGARRAIHLDGGAKDQASQR